MSSFLSYLRPTTRSIPALERINYNQLIHPNYLGGDLQDPLNVIVERSIEFSNMDICSGRKSQVLHCVISFLYL